MTECNSLFRFAKGSALLCVNPLILTLSSGHSLGSTKTTLTCYKRSEFRISLLLSFINVTVVNLYLCDLTPFLSGENFNYSIPEVIHGYSTYGFNSIISKNLGHYRNVPDTRNVMYVPSDFFFTYYIFVSDIQHNDLIFVHIAK